MAVEPAISESGPRRHAVRLTPLQVPKAPDVLADDLRERILRGDFPEGTALPTERELGERYGLSRASVREALRILESEGLIQTRPGRNGGASVKQPTADSIARSVGLFVRGRRIRLKSLLETREVIEPAVARLAALNRTDADIAALAEAQQAHIDLASRKTTGKVLLLP